MNINQNALTCASGRTLVALAAMLALAAGVAGQEQRGKRVVVLYPADNNGRPGNLLFDQGLRSALNADGNGQFDIHNEYLDVSTFADPKYEKQLAQFLAQKYAGKHIDLVIAALAPSLQFAMTHRDEVLPGVPLVFACIGEREIKGRPLPPGVAGVPINFDLDGTLDLALRLQPDTRHVFVVAGAAPFDQYWESQAREIFRDYEERVKITFLSGLPLNELLAQVAELPEHSVIYYLHVFRDGNGTTLVPAEVVERIAAIANAPVFGHVDSYVGRGIVGGRVFSFQSAGKDAARLGLRILAGEDPQRIGVQQTADNVYLFDWRQLRRWGIGEDRLPPGGEVRYRQPTFWDEYRWHILGISTLCVVQALLIAGLLVQGSKRRRAEESLRRNRGQMQILAQRLLAAQETERQRLARELHDDLNQGLALLSVELDLLAQKSPVLASALPEKLHELSARTRELSSSVHDLSHQLHPSKLAQLGLVATLRSLCRELAQSRGANIAFADGRVPVTVGADTALCLYRIAQESLGNALKHGRAGHISVELRGGDGELRLSVVDDGAGFDAAAANGGGGLGLISMRERAHLVGAEVVIDSRPGGGTRVGVRVPLTASKSPEPLEA